MDTVANQPSQGEWKYDKFDCCENPVDVLFSICCSNFYACATAQIAQPDSAYGLIAFCCPLALICVRSNVRVDKGIKGSFLNDCLSVSFLPCCTVIQMNKEFRDEIQPVE